MCISIIVLRRTRPDIERPFRCPAVPLVPALGVLFSLWLFSFLGPVTGLRFAVWFVLGLALYFGYGYRHSHLNRPRADLEVEAVRHRP